MTKRAALRLGAVFCGGCLGSAARLGVLACVSDAVVALAVVNLSGAFFLGVVSGLYGSRVTWLRTFLAVGGLGAFTSWSALAWQAVSLQLWLVVAVEALLGVAAAGGGHLLGRGRAR